MVLKSIRVAVATLLPSALSMVLNLDASALPLALSTVAHTDGGALPLTLTAIAKSARAIADMEQVFERSDEAHWTAMDAISKNLTLSSAIEALEESVLDSPNFRQVVSLLTGKQNLRSTHDGFGGLDGARKLLNDMIHETMVKYDKEVAKCSDYYAKQCALMEAARGQISASSFVAATARALILDASATIKKESAAIPVTELELKQHKATCKTGVKALNEKLKKVMGDIDIITMILKSTDCDKKLLQTDKLVLLRCKDQCTEQDYVTFNHGPLQQEMNQLDKPAHDLVAQTFADLFTGNDEPVPVKLVQLAGSEYQKVVTLTNEAVPRNGCSDESGSVPFVAGLVVGCNAQWSAPGLANGETACAAGFHICADNVEAEALGLTGDLCHDMPPAGQIYVTYLGTNAKQLKNDMLGCGRGLVKYNWKGMRGAFSAAMGNVDVGAWKGLTGHDTDEQNYVTKVAGDGGVLCCKDAEVTCLPVLCAEKAPEVTNAEREDSHTGRVVYPTTLRWKCKTGYSVDASPVDAKSKFQASCKAHGKLMGMMKCLPITCGTPHIFEFTQRVFPQSRTSILEYGQSAKYKCHEGYSIKGTPDGAVEFSSKCSATGVLGEPEVCEPIECGTAPRIAKCRSSVAGVVTYGMDVQYECDKGHTLSGLSGGEHHFHLKCKKDGTFEEPEGACRAVSGGAVPAIPGAKLFQYAGRPVEDGETLNAFYPQGLEYQCMAGYSLTGGVEGQTKFVTLVNSVGKFAPPLPLRCKRITFKIQGEVKNAQTGSGCIGCHVSIVGRNDEAITDDGFFTIDNIEAGQIKLMYSREGFISAEQTIEILGDVTSGGLADISMSPEMGSKEWRAVLKWGSYPEDLDSYASWATNTVSWDNPYAQSGYETKLEVDDTDGYGPETVHFSNVGTCDGGAYKCDIKYMINDYADTGNMFEDSEAVVDLYHGDVKAGSWNIKDCKDSLDEDGYWWHVFTINGKTNQLKWHCGQSASDQVFLRVGSNATLSVAKVDFENYVGPFPGRYFRKSRHAAAPKQIRRLRSQASK